MFKHKLMVLTAAAALAGSAHAEPGVFIGISYKLGGEMSNSQRLGLTAKILSTRDQDKAVAALGLSYYPNAESKLGLDAGIGYQGKHVAIIGSYDFLQKAFALSGGLTNSRSKRDTVAAADPGMPPAPAPSAAPAPAPAAVSDPLDPSPPPPPPEDCGNKGIKCDYEGNLGQSK